ncbi:hypothetical protein CONPUDRAFT_135296 [Coniophora puteana RWD-64-598 SS2]|uniref:Uncharacterized protein n=1 Tax=Coniophora puteana (strain RWD-64-598) TaxID=741705 RepID=A0A5M3N2U3_CONPW|nr:uncharacterized protein CONPUDRAFT_135296 [Coniophora puteana RWD-64-598 SS2]EIW85636.1 hypothetical protein CONPUDRAFT_135296 [Coniophora puteana RWD-64-598 SS2]
MKPSTMHKMEPSMSSNWVRSRHWARFHFSGSGIRSRGFASVPTSDHRTIAPFSSCMCRSWKSLVCFAIRTPPHTHTGEIVAGYLGLGAYKVIFS